MLKSVEGALPRQPSPAQRESPEPRDVQEVFAAVRQREYAELALGYKVRHLAGAVDQGEEDRAARDLLRSEK